MNTQLHSRLAQAAGCLSPPVFRLISSHFSELENTAREIRLRSARPLAVVCDGGTNYFTKSGSLTDLPCGDLYVVSREDIDNTFRRACDYSVYARQREICEGFVTLRGGHRIGVCGTAVTDKGGIINIRDVTSLCIRVSREHRGCGAGLFRRLRASNGGALVCGSPCSGKTTLLRDLARLFSTEEGLNTALIDERGELAAVTHGEPQNDVGLCDIYCGYPKASAVEQAVRTMSPDIIICDEIGSADDACALRLCLNSGVRVIAAVHASSAAELYARPVMKSILNTGAFETAVFLRGRNCAGEISAVVRLGEAYAA